ncbi:hypothetical protein K501DRAFT_149829, partial [Backusella circina FSU 941]
IISPQSGAVWHVGEKVQVVFKPNLPDNQTVAIFFYHQTDVLAGGSLGKSKVFEFVVPPTAVSPPGGTSLLLGVRRVEYYLTAVDQVNVTVL